MSGWQASFHATRMGVAPTGRLFPGGAAPASRMFRKHGTLHFQVYRGTHLTLQVPGNSVRVASPAATGSTYPPHGLLRAWVTLANMALPPGLLRASLLPLVERRWAQNGQEPASHGDAGGSGARWKRTEQSRKARKLSGQQSRQAVCCTETTAETARRVVAEDPIASPQTHRTPFMSSMMVGKPS